MLIVNPNLCFDRTLYVRELSAGTVSRPYRALVSAGGKGVNVARTLKILGQSPRILGFLPARGAGELTELLWDEGQQLIPVAIDGQVRSATIILEDGGRATVLNENGPTVTEDDFDRLLDAADRELASVGGPKVLVATGSVSPGTPETAYGQLAAVAHRNGALAIIDSARRILASALPFGPDLVCPNLEEAEGVFTGEVVEVVEYQGEEAAQIPARATAVARQLREAGAKRVVITAGRLGALYSDGQTEAWLPTFRVNAVNPIGAGDSFLGGCVAALHDALADGADIADTNTWMHATVRGLAVASAAVENYEAGRLDPARADELFSILEGQRT